MSTSPDGGVDRHGSSWVPVPLTYENYDPESKTYIIEFEAPRQLLLNPEYNAMVHDEILRHADRRGLMVEGQILISDRDKEEIPLPPEPDDDDTLDVVRNPAKEVEVQKAQEELGGMSKAEQEFRARMRRNMRDTADEALTFVRGNLDGRPLLQGREFKIDREAFLDGFFGRGPVTGGAARDVMVVRAEALIGLVLVDPSPEDGETETVSDGELPEGFVVPDDLSGLDPE